jgi:hypothetical protein
VSASGDHRNANPTAQIKRDAGWHFSSSGLSCEANDIAAEHTKAFNEGEKKRVYEAESSAAVMKADASFRDLMRKVWEVKAGWDPQRQVPFPREALDDDTDDGFNDGFDDDVEDGSNGLGRRDSAHDQVSSENGSADFDKRARVEELLAETRKLHDDLVDIILRFLPGRTFLKS